MLKQVWLMSCASLLLLSDVVVAQVQVGVEDARTVQVGPGSVSVEGQTYSLEHPQSVEILPVDPVAVTGERHEGLALFNPKAGGWRKGNRLQALVTEECTATGLLAPASLRVLPAEGDTPYVLDRDYALDPFWGTFGRLEGGAIAEDAPVRVEYTYTPSRIDLLVLDAQSQVHVQWGMPAVGEIPPPVAPPGTVLLCTVYQHGAVEALTGENLFPVNPLPETTVEPAANTLLPRTLRKLLAGEPLVYVAWGDSVTAGGGVGGDQSLWYQHRFVEALRERFPQADVALHTAAWPGAGSRQYLEAPAGGQYDFQRDVLDRKPDLVSIEFVNDAYLDEAGVAAHYGMIVSRLREAGAEVVLITPHLVRPDWMKVESQQFDEDPRPYVKGLKAFAAAEQVALADASALWCRLWREGVPYMTRLANSINHPDVPGHGLFVEALMRLFP